MALYRRGTPVERFWPKVDKNGPVPEHRPDLGPCWVWTAMTRAGYGQFRVARHMAAHRFAYELMVGPIPDGYDLDHLCRNRACVRPDHLEPVTRRENLRRGLSGELKTHCRHGHPFTPENRLPAGHGTTKCRICYDIADRDRRHAKGGGSHRTL
jgi:hypothetical protein